MLSFLLPAASQCDHDIVHASNLVTESMLNGPSYREIARGNENDRRKFLNIIFQKNLTLMREKAPDSMRFHYSEADGSLECFFMLVPNNAAPLTNYDKFVRAGVLDIIWHFGIATLMRVIRAADYHDAELEAVMGRRPHLVLQRMVVAPDKQGQGLGSRYLSRALAEADQQQLPVVLGTQEERNIVFYKRLGFEVVKEGVYSVQQGDDPGYNYTNYCLVREPRLVG